MPGETAARAIALPGVVLERLTVFGGKRVGNAALQVVEKTGEGINLCLRNALGISGE